MQKREFQLLYKKGNQFGKINKMAETKDILAKYKNIALVGASKNLEKTSSIVMKYLQNNGYKVYPVNPTIRGEKILGEKVYAKVSEIDGQVDIIDVFRPSNEAAEIANEAVKIRAKVLWLQLDIKSPEARKIAEANNIIYVENKCTKIEIEKYFN
jgi:predicted CoA-binding protein